MPDQHSPLDTALDVLVYVPVGLALTAAEELPKLAAKGRARVDGQVAVARMVGQFALAQGRQHLARRFGHGAGAGGDRPRPEPFGTGGPDRAPRPVHGPAPGASAPPEAPSAGAGDAGLTAAPAPPPERSRPPSAVRPPAPGAAAGAGGPEELAIPGYDSLSASQVVQRLAGLSRDELAAVGAYESSHRGRRTILTRVSQLQAG